MSAGATKINLLGMRRERLATLLGELGAKPYCTDQVMKWIYHRFHDRFDHMTDISKALRSALAEIAEIREPEVVRRLRSADGTRKWLVRSDSGGSVETVFIPEERRGTLCVSSQVGCALGCTFCATGREGFAANLTAAEIIGQVRLALRELAPDYPERERIITNIVLMGMGEPLLNLDNVLAALELMQHDMAFGLSKRRVTISTAGLVPQIYRLAEETDVALAVSLHAPNDALRDQLVPINRKYPIAALLKACRHYLGELHNKRTITFEYTLLAGVNDQPAHAAELVALLRGFPCKINLIPFNPFPGSGIKRPNDISVKGFQNRLVDAGLAVMVRTTRGGDISAACGQLVGEVEGGRGAGRSGRQARAPSGAAEKIELMVQES